MNNTFNENDFDDEDNPFDNDPLIQFTYICPCCKAGIVRMPKIGIVEAHWVCLSFTSCGATYRDFRGRPIGNPERLDDDNPFK